MKVSRASLAAAMALGASVYLAPAIGVAEESVPAPRIMRLQERLDLTEDQVRAVREIRERQRESWVRIARALGQAHRELRQLALGGSDDGTIQAKIGEIARLRDEALRLRVRTLQELGPILTQEQREKLGQSGWWGPGPRGPHRHRS